MIAVLLGLALLAPLDRAVPVRRHEHPEAVQAAERGALVRHRRIWPRRPQPHALRRAPVARDGHRGDIDQPRHRRAARACRRLQARRGRRMDHARHGRPDVVPADHARSARAGERQPRRSGKPSSRSASYTCRCSSASPAASRSISSTRSSSRRRRPVANGTGYILAAEILPNAWPPIAVEASLRVTFAILLGAALSFWAWARSRRARIGV